MNDRHELDFAAFVAGRGSALLRTARGITGAQHAAEDLLQTALERAFVRWRRLEDPEAYVIRVMYNEYTSSWRRRLRRKEDLVATIPDVKNSADGSAELAMHQEVRAALDLLPPRQRAVVVLRYLDDRSESDVAALLGCSPSTVSSHLSRALATLRAAHARDDSGKVGHR